MGNVVSRAASELRKRLTPVMNQSDLAKRLGVTPQAVSAWVSGRALPEPERMAQIELILGIPMRDWVGAAPEATEQGEEPEAKSA